MKIDVLDKGFVEKMMCADSDLTVVNCARVSFGKESSFICSDEELHAYTSDLIERKSLAWLEEHDDRIKDWIEDIVYPCVNYEDTKLIHYLARNNHWTPFAHPIIRLRVKAPIFIRTQLFKHKFGAVENEVSRRYVDDEPEFYFPEPRSRPDASVKQGSGGSLNGVRPLQAKKENDAAYKQCRDSYELLLDLGVAPEQARMVLPQSTYTEWIWTGSLAFFARVYNQRSDPHAQWEAQQYAKAIGEIVEPLFPVSWAALTQ